MKILMVSSIQIFPLDSGNKIRIYNLIQRMRSMGTEVDFLYCKDNFFSPVSEAAIKEMRREIGADHFFLFSDLEIKLSAKLKRKLRELLEKCNLSKKIIHITQMNCMIQSLVKSVTDLSGKNIMM